MPFLYGSIGLVLGVICGILFMRVKPIFGLKEAQKKVQKAVKEAETKAEQIVRSAQLDAKSLTYGITNKESDFTAENII